VPSILYSRSEYVGCTIHSGIRELPTHCKRLYFLGLLLAAIVLVAQLHCCVDLRGGILDSHACPVCVTVGAAIAVVALIIAVGQPIQRLETRDARVPLLVVVFRTTTPRAPPLAS